mmetsp:Transcript_20174/g.47095  ORF Transcript_20174/g.47095 Transcript_20174/m.47095 type:complete len:233 (-) Transcript_20174:830-1528(-)
MPFDELWIRSVARSAWPWLTRMARFDLRAPCRPCPASESALTQTAEHTDLLGRRSEVVSGISSSVACGALCDGRMERSPGGTLTSVLGTHPLEADSCCSTWSSWRGYEASGSVSHRSAWWIPPTRAPRHRSTSAGHCVSSRIGSGQHRSSAGTSLLKCWSSQKSGTTTRLAVSPQSPTNTQTSRGTGSRVIFSCIVMQVGQEQTRRSNSWPPLPWEEAVCSPACRLLQRSCP